MPLAALQLRRITTTGRWVPQVDGLRFVAIVSVVCFHILGQTVAHALTPVVIQPRYRGLESLIGNGDRGVSLFFVISGYILALPFLRQWRNAGKKVSLGSYFARRASRLEPPYVISLLIYTAALMVFPGTPLRVQFPHLVASALYLHNLVYGSLSTINFVTWSLEVEIQFYILAPLIGMVYAIRSQATRTIVFVLLMIFCGSFHLYASDTWLRTVFNYGHYFLAGFLMADILGLSSGPRPTSRWWDVVSLAGWPTIFLLPRSGLTLQWLPFLILPVYLAAFYGPITLRIFSNTFVALTGGMCYSFYLLHMLAISIAFKGSRHLIRFQDFALNLGIQIAVLGSAVALVGTAYYILVERPCMNPQWPQQLWQRLRPNQN